jgi:transposase
MAFWAIISASQHLHAAKTDLITPGRPSEALSRCLHPAPRSVQYGFTHRLRDGKNHIYCYGELVMQKKYIVRLTDDERDILRSVVKKLKGSSQKVRRAQMLLKADAEGPNWTDKQIAEAFSCRTKTVENVRQKFVTEGFDASLNRKKRDTPPRSKLLDGEQEARIIALRLGKPPEGYANWSLRLLAENAVELEIVESISYETVRRTLKKTV